ncbi:MAG: hypothetical protein MUF72_23210 [Elainella sp. Prado103]|nr:hypothetical protein [Elainella sp. Prado103]
MTNLSIGLVPNSIGAIPPLPTPIAPEPLQPAAASNLPQPAASLLQPIPIPFPPIQIRSLRCGCYLLNYQPSGSALVSYDGTLRVECHSGGRTASGDLYQRPVIFLPSPIFPPRPPQPILLPGPNPANGIPILSRSRYRYYLRITQILEYFTIGNSFTLGLEMYRFTAPNTWVNEGSFTAVMSWSTAPAGYPASNDYLTGDVKNSSGAVVGRLTMGWISTYFRKATIEIDRVSASEAPLENGSGINWRSIFDTVGWDVTVSESTASLTEPSGSSWSDAELHQVMLAQRDSANLDGEWRYHLLAVRFLDSTDRGIMYDAYASDSNNVPREGAAISSHWVIPNADPWGLVKGQRFGTATSPYFRTAVHELGHAMGLYHNTVDNGFMNTTPTIASAATPATPFPNNVQWSFAPDDEKRLRHYPDIFVRPGGVAFGSASSTTPLITPTDLEVEMEGLELRVSPVLESVPLGAPVRVNLELVNISDQPIVTPASLKMKLGFVQGQVVDPAGTIRTFLPLVHCIEDHPLTLLKPGQSLTHSLTLLRGGQGALFPTSGLYQIKVEVHWDSAGVEASVTGQTDVLVTGTVDASHAAAARQILATPDTLLTLVLGGDHLTDGIAAIQTALKNPVLRPHYAYIEAKRLAKRFGERKANLKIAQELIEKSTVMSPTEAEKAADFSVE